MCEYEAAGLQTLTDKLMAFYAGSLFRPREKENQNGPKRIISEEKKIGENNQKKKKYQLERN